MSKLARATVIHKPQQRVLPLHRRFGKTAVVVVDMDEISKKRFTQVTGSYVDHSVKNPKIELVSKGERCPFRLGRYFTYSHGEVDLGIQRCCTILELAKNQRIPIFVFSYPVLKYSIKPFPELSPEPIPEIKQVLGNYPIYLRKSHTSIFNDPTFQVLFGKEGYESIIIMGFHIAICIHDSIQGGVKKGLNVLTSEQLLFGSVAMDPQCPAFIELANMYRICSDKVIDFPTSEEIVDLLTPSDL